MRIRGTLISNSLESSLGGGGCSSGVDVSGLAGGFNRARLRGGGASKRAAVVGGVDAEEGGVGNMSGIAVISWWLCWRDDRLCRS